MTAAVALAVIGTGLQVAGTLQQGRAEAQNALIVAENEGAAADARAGTNEFNAKVAEQKARSELDVADADAADFRFRQSARLATQRARQGGSGFALEGSPLLIDEADFQQIEFGASRIGAQGRIRSSRLETQASLLSRNADVERANASRLRSAGRTSARNIRTSSFLRAGSQAALGAAKVKFG